MAYSTDYKRRVVEYRREGHSLKELVDVFKISLVTYYRWEKEYENNFEKPSGPRVRSRKIDKERLRKAVEEHPDYYLREYAALFDCTPQAVYNMLKKLKITYKKKPIPIPKNQKK